MRWIVLLTSAALVLAATRPAGACLPADCSESPSPIDNTVLPAGTMALPGSATGLVDAAGNAVPFTQADDERTYFFVRLDGPLPEGDYQLRLPDQCDKSGKSEVSHPFRVGPAAPAPSLIGTLRAERQETPEYKTNNDCDSSHPQLVSAALAFEPSAELRPYLPLTRLWITVDGALWSSTSFGAEARSLRTVSAACGATPETRAGYSASQASDFVAPGHHEIQLHAKIAGADQELPPLTLAVDLTCPPPAAADAAEVDNATSSDSSGCSLAGIPSSSPAAVAIGALLGGLLYRRRRITPGTSRRRRWSWRPSRNRTPDA
jgi:hypothetical protein